MTHTKLAHFRIIWNDNYWCEPVLLLAELESPTAMIVTSTLYNILTLTTSSCSLHPDIGVHQDTIQHHMINHIILDSTCLLFYFFIFFIFSAGTYTFGAGNLVLENAYLVLDRGLSLMLPMVWTGTERFYRWIQYNIAQWERNLLINQTTDFVSVLLNIF